MHLSTLLLAHLKYSLQIGRDLAPFRNKGWPFYDKMSNIYPEGASRGNVSFQPVEANAGLGGNMEFGEDADANKGFGLPPPGNDGIIGPSSQPDSSGQLFVSAFDSTPTYQLGPAGNQEFSSHEGMGLDLGLNFDFDLDQLLGIVPAVTSPEALMQEAAVRSIIGTLNQAMSGLHICAALCYVYATCHIHTTLCNLPWYTMPHPILP